METDTGSVVSTFTSSSATGKASSSAGVSSASVSRSSASAAGAHGVVITKHDGVGVNATVDKVSAGAASFTPVARVTSLPSVMEDLKKAGVWITGADGGSDTSLFEADLSGAVAIVVGNEGEGMSRLVREKCDFLVKIPMRGQTESLNASVAAALFMFEVARKR